MEALEKNDGKPISTHEMKEIWEPPPPGVVKVDTNASFPSRELRGCGAIICDCLEQFVAFDVQKW